MFHEANQKNIFFKATYYCNDITEFANIFCYLNNRMKTPLLTGFEH